MEPTSIFVAIAFYAFLDGGRPGFGIEAGERPFPTKEACEEVLTGVKDQLMKQAEAHRLDAPLIAYSVECVALPVTKFKYAVSKPNA